MNSKKTLITLLGILVLTAAVLAVMLKQPEKPLTKPHKDVLPVVSTQVVNLQDQALDLQMQASLEPQQQLMLSADLAARVDWLASEFVEGGFVKQGQVLLRLRKTEFELALAQAKANVAQTRLALLEEQALSEQAEEDWRSVKNAIKSDSASELTLRKPQLALAKANYQAAKIALQQARVDLANCELKAPFNAYIGSRDVELGQYIQANTVVAQLIGTDRAQLRLPIKPKQVSLLPKDVAALEAQVFDSKHQYASELEIKHLQAGLDSRAQVYYLLAYLNDPYGLASAAKPWYIGQFLDVDLRGVSLAASFKVPAASLHEDTYIYALDPHVGADGETLDEAVIKRLATDVLLRQGDDVYLRLADADVKAQSLEIITNDPGFLVNGMTVRIINSTQSQTLDRLDAVDVEAAP